MWSDSGEYCGPCAQVKSMTSRSSFVTMCACRYPCGPSVPVHEEAAMSVTNISPVQVIPADALLQHWQGHRRLTRRVIEAFPEDQLFSFSIGGMRTFGAMSLELIGIAAPMVRGIMTVRPLSMISGRRSRLSDLVRQ